MTRFTLSTCGVVAEVVSLDSAAPVTTITLAVAGVLVAVAIWWSDVRPVIDHLVGLDL